MTKMTEILVLIHRKTLALHGAPEPEFQSSLPWGSLGCCCHWISELEPLRLRGLEMFGEHDVNKLNKVQEWTHQLGHWANSAPVFFIVIQYFTFLSRRFPRRFHQYFFFRGDLDQLCWQSQFPRALVGPSTPISWVLRSSISSMSGYRNHADLICVSKSNS